MRWQDGDLPPNTIDPGVWIFTLYVASEGVGAISLPAVHSASYQEYSICGPVVATVLGVPPATGLACRGFSRRTSQQFDQIAANAAAYHRQFAARDQDHRDPPEPLH